MARQQTKVERAAWHVAEAADRLAEDDGADAAAHLRAALSYLEAFTGERKAPKAARASPSRTPRVPSRWATLAAFLRHVDPAAIRARNLSADCIALRADCDARGLPVYAAPMDEPAFPRTVLFDFYLDLLATRDWGRPAHA